MDTTAVEIAQTMFLEGRSPAEVRGALQQHGVDESLIDRLLAFFQSTRLGIDGGAPGLGTAPAAAAPSQAVTAAAQPAARSIRFRLAAGRWNAGWLLIAAICLIPIIVILFDQPWTTRFATSATTLSMIGNSIGTIALALYAVDMVLATRLPWLEDLFGGLNRVYIAHHICGGLALIAMLVHPIFPAIKQIPSGWAAVAKFFIPNANYLGTAFGIIALWIVVAILIATFFMKLPYRLWYRIHRFLGITFLLIGLHIVLTPNSISRDPFIKVYLLALLAIGLMAYVYRTVLPNVFIRHYLYTIRAAEPKGVGVIELTLAPVSQIMNFKAGQFVFISFGADGLSSEWHPFSIASAPTDGSLKIDIKSLGSFTETLTRLLPLMVGMTVKIEGAYGRFSFKNFHNTRQIWIAGGIGITPFLSMAQDFQRSGPYNIDLYYSARTRSELFDVEKLAALQSNQPGRTFRVFPFVGEVEKRFLTGKIIAATTTDFRDREILLCGPPSMMHALNDQLAELGVSPENIHSEEFTMS